MASNGLTATPLGEQGGFNWLFLVDLIVCGILALFFIFYFNRTVSTIISYAIRAWTWHKYRAYILSNSHSWEAASSSSPSDTMVTTRPSLSTMATSPGDTGCAKCKSL
jgi:hypothetical protein